MLGNRQNVVPFFMKGFKKCSGQEECGRNLCQRDQVCDILLLFLTFFVPVELMNGKQLHSKGTYKKQRNGNNIFET